MEQRGYVGLVHEGKMLNAIELNASFYRFPFPNQVKGWSAKDNSLTWVIKINRLITHTHMLNEKAIELFQQVPGALQAS
ncbi:MAG: DUF72 domain-containing protein [Candidatus Micrarchaeia archaeon]